MFLIQSCTPKGASVGERQLPREVRGKQSSRWSGGGEEEWREGEGKGSAGAAPEAKGIMLMKTTDPHKKGHSAPTACV